MAWDRPAAALWLSLTLSVAMGVSGTPPPSPGWAVTADRADGARLLTKECQGWSVEQQHATPYHSPPPAHCSGPPAAFVGVRLLGQTFAPKRFASHPRRYPVERRSLSTRPVDTISPGGGGGWARSRSRSVRELAAVPQLLCPLPYRHRPTPAWGPLPPRQGWI